jgi:hypothetical protein
MLCMSGCCGFCGRAGIGWCGWYGFAIGGGCGCAYWPPMLGGIV